MRRRVVFIALGGLLLVLVVLAAGWRDLAAARSQVNSARSELSSVVEDPQSLRAASGRAASLTAIRSAGRQLDRASARIRNSLPLRFSSALPALARQRTGILTLIADARAGTATSERLLQAVDELAAETRLEGGRIPLDGLAKVQRVVTAAGVELQKLQREPNGLWAGLANARTELNDVTKRASRSLRDGGDAIGAARSIMGASEPRRYLVAVQNNAEMRDQGMVLSYAVVRFEGGGLTVEKTGPITDLPLSAPVDVTLPAGTEQIFGSQQPLRLWQNANATADWPLSARTMAAMYRQTGGAEVDGVMALDVPGLSATLRVIGSVPNPAGGEAITAANADKILLHDYYSQVPRGEQGLRRERLGEVAAAVVTRLTTGRHDAIALGRELGTAAAGGHFRLWSTRPDEESVLRRTGLGGGPAVSMADRTFHLSVQNASSSKLDYYQRQKVRLDVYLTDIGTAVVRTSLGLTNTAPKDAAPSYQLGPGGATQKKPGEYPARIYFWGPLGSVGRGVPESGLTLSYSSVLVQPGTTETVVFHTAIAKAVRNGRLDLRLVPQPVLVPADLEVRLHAPGWSVQGEKTISRAWDRTITVSWDVKS